MPMAGLDKNVVASEGKTIVCGQKAGNGRFRWRFRYASILRPCEDNRRATYHALGRAMTPRPSQVYSRISTR